MKVVIDHGSYGCDCGCCGTWVGIDGSYYFDFTHYDNDEDAKEIAEYLIKKHRPDLLGS